MTGVSLVLTGMLTPICAGFIRDDKKSNDTCAYESDDIRMAEVPKELEFLNVHYQGGTASTIRTSGSLAFGTHLRSTALGTPRWLLSGFSSCQQTRL